MGLCLFMTTPLHKGVCQNFSKGLQTFFIKFQGMVMTHIISTKLSKSCPNTSKVAQNLVKVAQTPQKTPKIKTVKSREMEVLQLHPSVDAQELTLNNCAGFLNVIVQKGQADVLSLASTNEWAFTECLLSKYSEIKPITSS